MTNQKKGKLVKPKKIKEDNVDLAQLNLEKLKKDFPSVVSEDHIDYEKLRLLLGDEKEGDGKPREQYKFTWPGKTESIRAAQTPPQGTLIPDKDSSVDWDKTENLYLEGDNLEILKLLQKSYSNKIKMIYIDPPYNTGKDFIYPDKYGEGLKTYLEYTGQIDGDGKKLSTNTETDGRYHSKWLSMMYPRLMLARNLLAEDGVLFISIDDHEVSNLRKLCDEVFGAENFIALIPVVMNLKGNQDVFGFAETHEYFLAYGKNKDNCVLSNFDIDEEDLLKEWCNDEYGLYKEADNLRATGVNAPRTKRPNLWYPIFINDKTKDFYITEDDKPKRKSDVVLFPKNPEGEELSWYWGKKTFNQKKHNLILKETSNGHQFYRKQRPQLGDLPSKKPKSIFYKPDYSSSTATTKLKELLNGKLFNNPKPVPFIKDLLIIGTSSDCIVLDFFSGSATTAHAVMELNAEDGGKRKCIMTQLQEPTPEESEAYKAGYKDISKIGEERIRRVVKNIFEDNKENSSFKKEEFDGGFKVYKLVESTFSPWDNSSEGDIQLRIESAINPIKEDSTDEDILTEIILKSGFSLTEKIIEEDIKEKKVYSIADGALLITLEDGLNLEFIREIASKTPARFISLEKGFDSDDLLTNTDKIMKDKGVDFRTI
jgi:adenine-specific DNA-methyltransferase